MSGGRWSWDGWSQSSRAAPSLGAPALFRRFAGSHFFGFVAGQVQEDVIETGLTQLQSGELDTVDIDPSQSGGRGGRAVVDGELDNGTCHVRRPRSRRTPSTAPCCPGDSSTDSTFPPR